VGHERGRVDLDVETTPDILTAPVCPVDVDGRAPLDLFFGLREGDGDGSRLYVADEVGAYTDETADRGLAGLPDVYGCLPFDDDGDGDQDLLLTGLGHISFFRNDDGRFVAAPERLLLEPGFVDKGQYVGAAAGDLDGDGDVDLVVAGNAVWDREVLAREECDPIPCEAETGFLDPVASLLLLRGGDGIWRDRTIAFSEELTQPEHTLVVGVVDFDLDDSLDVFVGNDFQRDDFVLSRDGRPGGRLRDVAADLAIGVDYQGLGLDTMGWSQGDLDGDGILDHVVTGFESDPTAVHRSAGDFILEDGPDTGTEAREGTLRWGPALGDLDLDGDVDLVEATGHIFPDRILGLLRERGFGRYDGDHAQPTNLYLNDGTGRLLAVAPSPGDALGDAWSSRGISLVDLDDDGDLDVVLGNLSGPPQLLRNDRAAGHWLRIRLVGDAANPEAIGARVEAVQAGVTRVRHRVVGEGYGGAFDPRLHFGFPRRDPVALRVHWPDGSTTEVGPVRVDRELVIRR
ncbi:MAG TPA: FG-GAP-like repeat-containing protein, partial [Polyangiaceae bacterium LLY-WYZ-14_1]|nr:FG-GAP-like repeat-containing protein [Polyangiaceae bacterium LLY-WYZ-14_1]